MKKEHRHGEAHRVDDLIAEMGRERAALRAKRITISLLLASSIVCLLSAVASLAGYLPYAVDPVVVMICASSVGLVLVYFETRSP